VTRRSRLVIFLVGAGCVAAMFVLAVLVMPDFGGTHHLYRDLAVHASVRHHTANVISSVNFDQRAIDTFGEETIVITSVVAAAVLLRPAEGETERRIPRTGRNLPGTRLLGYVLIPVTLIVGLNLVTHGQLTPGGGFQGGVVLATGLHLLYVTGSYPALDRLRPITAFDVADALGAATFAAVGLAGVGFAGTFAANIMPWGTFGQLFSGGIVPVLNVAVGLEVFGGMVVLLAKFLEQDISVTKGGSS
jgi:multicomponent Na+:H+ antiporter subunit B